LAEFASACGLELANGLGVEANANYEQNRLSIDLAYRNGAYLAAHQCAHNSFRRTLQTNLASEDICGAHGNDAQGYWSPKKTCCDVVNGTVPTSGHNRVEPSRNSGLGGGPHALAMSARFHAL
jgi:hypothetical protein